MIYALTSSAAHHTISWLTMMHFLTPLRGVRTMSTGTALEEIAPHTSVVDQTSIVVERPAPVLHAP